MWQIILPILVAIFSISCSENIVTNNKTSYINSEFYSNPNDIKNIQNILNTQISYNKEQDNINKILNETKHWKYTPYKLGGISKIDGADCSAFTQAIYKKVFRMHIDRTTVYQKELGKKVTKRQLKAGDLLFFKTHSPSGLHVGIYLENNNFIHLSSKGGARIQNLNVKYWKQRFLGARRYLDD